jgi:hypothetical protein
MRYTGMHRNVAFSVHYENGAWKYAIKEESFGQFSQWEHAIHAAIRHIDRILFEASGPGRE